MPVRNFPDPRLSTPEGIVAVGGDLHPDSLLLAYRNGIFPWPAPGHPLLWFSPPERAILRFSHLHIPRSLARARRRSDFRFSFDTAFERVIAACARAKRPGQRGTWITAAMREAYLRLHKLGFAHSAEAWDGEELVAGIYGVDVDGLFAGESMFTTRPNASKLALLHLVDRLRAAGCTWMDIQVMTPHMEALGAEEISRDAFLARLAKTRARGLKPFAEATASG